MTDKQIITDGVDVSGCIYFKKNNKMSMCRACNSGVGTPYCEYHKDCYYKQLKRKEQALDEIEKYLDAQQKYFDGEDYHNLLDIINEAKEENNDR